MSRQRQKNRELLGALCAAGFEFVVVGGVAAVLHGSARLTVDLDVAAPFTAVNLERLFDTIRPHRPVHATRSDLSVLDEPIERLTGFRLLLIDTALGRLDVLREVTTIGEWADLDTIEMEMGSPRSPCPLQAPGSCACLRAAAPHERRDT